MTHLNEETENTLKALYASMTVPELDEALQLLWDEMLKRSLEDEENPNPSPYPAKA